jgi:hypothetical protein
MLTTKVYKMALKMKYIGLLLGLVVFSVTAKMPGFDIYIGDLKVKNGLLSIHNINPLTDRPEYDNQPHFLADGESLLYTSARIKDGIEQTDIIWVSLQTGESINLTDSLASEYSPTPMPNGQDFSVIRAVGEQQKLWRYPLINDGKSQKASEILANVNPVGYQAWIDPKQVLLFVLGAPHELQVANTQKQTANVLDTNIGASLYKIPGTELMSYSQSEGEGENLIWRLKSLDPKTHQIRLLTTLPKDAYYYGWAADEKVIAAQGAMIKQWDSQRSDAEWHTFADLSKICPKGVTRMTTNPQNTKIALVCTL